MKKILFILMATVLIFACKGPKNTDENIVNPENRVAGELRIAVVNTDSLMAHFDMVIDKQDEIEKANTKLTNDLTSQQAKLKADYDNYLKVGATMTLSEQQNKEASLQQRAQNLSTLEQKYTQQLGNLSMQSQVDITNAIYDFIEKYNVEHQNFDLILTKSRMGGASAMYSNPAFDITQEIITAINADYAKSLKAKK
jgi:outer membrane protein